MLDHNTFFVMCLFPSPRGQCCLHPEVRALEQSLWTFGHAKGGDYRCQLSFNLESLWDVNWVNLWCLKHLEFHTARKHFFLLKKRKNISFFFFFSSSQHFNIFLCVDPSQKKMDSTSGKKIMTPQNVLMSPNHLTTFKTILWYCGIDWKIRLQSYKTRWQIYIFFLIKFLFLTFSGFILAIM